MNDEECQKEVAQILKELYEANRVVSQYLKPDVPGEKLHFMNSDEMLGMTKAFAIEDLKLFEYEVASAKCHKWKGWELAEQRFGPKILELRNDLSYYEQGKWPPLKDAA